LTLENYFIKKATIFLNGFN